MNWKEVFKSESFWIEKVQNELYVHVRNFLEKKNWTQKRFADELDVSEGYVSQILNGDVDHKYSKLAEISIAVNKTPWVVWLDLDEFSENLSNSIPEHIMLRHYANKLEIEEKERLWDEEGEYYGDDSPSNGEVGNIIFQNYRGVKPPTEQTKSSGYVNSSTQIAATA